MELPTRLHALDAVRALALLLGLVLHTTAAFLQDFPIPMWKDEPSGTAAVLYFGIHMFRMSAFFLIAGFFARLVVERRGTRDFIKDRLKRIAVPLFVFGPVVVISIGIGFGLGALTHGLSYVMSAGQQAQGANTPAAAGLEGGGGGISTAHLWFLYYLLIFYIIALLLRGTLALLDKQAVVARALDPLISLLLKPLLGPLLIAVPLAAWLLQQARWNEWLGLPAPQLLIPDATAMVGYGLAFGLGWLMQRQTPRLLQLQQSWVFHLVTALALMGLCLALIGITPRWQGPNLAGNERALYAVAYCVGMWCWIYALVGVAVRYLSDGNAKLRYLADASYWIYLMHMTTIIFFVALLKPWALPWYLKFAITLCGSLPLLLGSYHCWVRFTWLGAILNGRRHPRPQTPV